MNGRKEASKEAIYERRRRTCQEAVARPATLNNIIVRGAEVLLRLPIRRRRQQIRFYAMLNIWLVTTARRHVYRAEGGEMTGTEMTNEGCEELRTGTSICYGIHRRSSLPLYLP